jgi:hypothetical protein
MNFTTTDRSAGSPRKPGLKREMGRAGCPISRGSVNLPGLSCLRSLCLCRGLRCEDCGRRALAPGLGLLRRGGRKLLARAALCGQKVVRVMREGTP